MSRKKRIEPKADEYIKAHYPDELTSEVAKAIGLPVSYVHRRARELGLKYSDRHYSLVAKRARAIGSASKIEDPQAEAYIREHYADDLITDIAVKVGYSETWVVKRAKDMGLTHSEAYYEKIRQRGRKTK